MPTFDPNAAAAPGSGIYGLPHSPDDAGVIVLPVPFEATTSYGSGAANGPAAILAASRQVDLFDVETGRPYQAGIAMLEEPQEIRRWSEEARALAGPIIQAGGADPSDAAAKAQLARVDQLCDDMNAWVTAEATHWLNAGKLVVTVGGDHGTAFGAIRAHADRYPGMGVLHVDAHADLRDAYEGFTWSHASILFNVAPRLPGVSRIVQVAVRDLGEGEHELIQKSGGRVRTFFDAELASRRFEGVPWSRAVDEIASALPDQVYVSFDIDGLDPVLCPHTGTPVPGGLSFAEASALLAGLVRHRKRVVGLDLTEVVPGPEGDEWDGNVGARLLYKLIGWALKSRA